jgi:hypothetical protein
MVDQKCSEMEGRKEVTIFSTFHRGQEEVKVLRPVC